MVVFVKKVEKKKFFVSLPSLINTPLRGNRREATTSTTQQNDERSKKVDSSVGQSSGGESSRGDENERGILLPETVGSKVSRINSHIFFFFFFFFFSLLFMNFDFGLFI